MKRKLISTYFANVNATIRLLKNSSYHKSLDATRKLYQKLSFKNLIGNLILKFNRLLMSKCNKNLDGESTHANFCSAKKNVSKNDLQNNEKF